MNLKAKIIFISSVVIPFLITLGTLLNKYLDLYKKAQSLTEKNEHQRGQIVKRNLVINNKQDEIYGLIEDTEECITTRKYLESNNKELRGHNFNLIRKAII